jgi:2,3-dihydroxybenzoate decarboxylase
MGIDRIMFAIDYPYVVNQDGMDWIDTLQISSEDRAKILGGTAKKLLRL